MDHSFTVTWNEAQLDHLISPQAKGLEDTKNILDLFFSNYPDMINRHDVIPGLSDHEIPFLDVSTKISLSKKKSRRVYQYKKGNMEGLVSDLSQFSDVFCNKHSNKDWLINDMWNELKSKILEVMDKHIPSKMLSSSKHLVPWVTARIRREIRNEIDYTQELENQITTGIGTDTNYRKEMYSRPLEDHTGNMWKITFLVKIKIRNLVKHRRNSGNILNQ